MHMLQWLSPARAEVWQPARSGFEKPTGCLCSLMASYEADIEKHGGTVALSSRITSGHVSGTFTSHGPCAFMYAIESGRMAGKLTICHWVVHCHFMWQAEMVSAGAQLCFQPC